MVLSLYAKGLTTGEISAHFAEIYGVSVSGFHVCDGGQMTVKDLEACLDSLRLVL
jgi:transposase-like protein